MSGPNRRHFLQAAGLAGGAGLLGGAELLGQKDKTGGSAGKEGEEKPVPLAPPDRQPPELKVPEAPPRKVGWAVVGLGQLALDEVMPAFGLCKLSRPTALVSGHPDKAKKVAAAYGIDPKNIYNYDNYDKLADNPAVDVIYIILPNHMHAEFTVRGLKAGKHVLCEKPMAVTVAECEKMIAASREAKRKLMIAYRLHYEPLNQAVMKLSQKKEMGALRTIASSNCQDTKAPNIRLSKKTGGGPVGDIGIYSINATRYIAHEEPAEVMAYAHHPKGEARFREVPGSVAWTMRFPSGVLAHCDCSFASERSNFYRAHFQKGVIEMAPAFQYRGLRLFVHRGDHRDELRLEQVNHFTAEMDHFSGCVLNNKAPATPGEEGLADMRVVTAIDESIRSGKPVSIRKS